jgi:regulator of RNase E activity RraA
MTTIDDETIEAFRHIATPTLANALDDLGLWGVMQGLTPMVHGLRCVGRAVTVLEVTGPKGSFEPADFKVGHMIDAANPGDVVVVDNGGQPVSTWGGLASYAAKVKGIAGLVVDGGVRDREEMEEFSFPVFARHMVPTPGRTRIRVAAIGEPVSCGGVRVRAGDLIVADGTGVICVPAEAAKEACELATRFTKDDRQAQDELDKGLTFREAMAKFTRI